MTEHYSEADLLETYYMQPGQSMPVMMHLARCNDCAAKYERLERKLRDAATCSPEKDEGFWARQRMSVMGRIDHGQVHNRQAAGSRLAAAALILLVLGGAILYRGAGHSAPGVITKPAAAVQKSTAAEDTQLSADPWQSDELEEFQPVVEWESWLAEAGTKGEHSL